MENLVTQENNNRYQGTGKINQLGGVFVNGRALPYETRLKIVELAAAGVKSSEIARELRVSHGCISKIINRYQETGSIRPGVVGGFKQKITNRDLQDRIQQYQKENPNLPSWEIRDKLVADGTCDKNNTPTLAAIENFLTQKNDPEKSPNLNQDPISDYDYEPNIHLKRKRKNRTAFTIEQLEELERAFAKVQYPDIDFKMELAQRTNLTEGTIRVWFSNRRARLRKQMIASSSPHSNLNGLEWNNKTEQQNRTDGLSSPDFISPSGNFQIPQIENYPNFNMNPYQLPHQESSYNFYQHPGFISQQNQQSNFYSGENFNFIKNFNLIQEGELNSSNNLINHTNYNYNGSISQEYTASVVSNYENSPHYPFPTFR